MKSVGRDADDGEARAVEGDGTSEHVVVAAEAALPQVVREDDVGVCALGLVVRRGEDAPDRRADAEDFEIVARYMGSRHDFGGCAFLAGDGEGQRAAAAVRGDDAGVGLIVVADVDVVRVIERGRGLLGIAGDDGELLRRAHRQGAQHDVVDEGEDGRVGADSERQG